MQTLQLATVAALRIATTTRSSTDVGEWCPTLDAYEASLSKAVFEARAFAYAAQSGASPYWLTFTGSCGCGKTMLARQIFDEAAKSNPGNASLWYGPRRRPRSVWMTADKFADRMREGEYDLPEYLADDFLVVVDDIGTTRDKTDFVADGLFRLCANRLGKWTIFTTNLRASEIPLKIDERVASRMVRDNNRIISIKAGDYSALKK